jgi:hypothetical protein
MRTSAELTVRQIRQDACEILPEARVRRLLLWRWRKPVAAAG